MSPRKPPLEPMAWMLFSSGGMVVALFVPILIVLFGVAFPLGWLDPPEYEHLHAVVSHWLTALVLLGLCVLALFHWAHRFRYTLHEGLQLKRAKGLVIVLCYGGAVVGSIAAVIVLARAL